MRLFERPRAISRSTSSSRGVSTSSARGRAPPASCSTTRVATAGESGAWPACAVRIARTSSAGSVSLSRKPAAPRAQRGEQAVVLAEARQDEHARRRARARAARASARDAVEPRHREVEQHDVGLQPRRGLRRPPRRRPPRRRPRRRPAAPGRSAAPGARRRGRRRSGRGSRRDLEPHGGARARPRRRWPAARPARPRAPPSTSARAGGRAPRRAPASNPRAVVGDGQHAAGPGRRRAAPRSARRRRGGARSAAPPGRSGTPRRRPRRPARGGAATRSSIAWPDDAPQHVDVLAQRLGEPLGLERRRAQLEHDRAQLVHRAARQLLHALDLRRRRPVAAREQLARRLGREHDAEQLLGDGVVQLAREPVALLDDAQLAAALVQPRVLDRERGVRGEQRRSAARPRRRTPSAPVLVGEVERADDAAARHDRHAEERAHVGVRATATSRGSAGACGCRRCGTGSGDSSIAPSSPCVRGSGPIAAISSSLIPDVMKRANAPSPSGTPSAA